MRDIGASVTILLLFACMFLAITQIVGCASHKPVNADDFAYTLKHQDRYFTKGEE